MENQDKNQIMENQMHRAVLLDHEMIVDGVVFRERKELNLVEGDEENEEKSILVHTRYIADKKYEVHQVKDTAKDEVIEETVNTDMDEVEVNQFKEEWEEKWQPTIGQNRSGIAQFFKNLLFLN